MTPTARDSSPVSASPALPPSVPPPVPARMLNEFTYCPRLAYLEWVQKGSPRPGWWKRRRWC